MNVDDFLDFEFPADANAEIVYGRLRSDERMSGIIKKLKDRGLTDGEILITFRHVSHILSDWEVDKEASKIKQKRRTDTAVRLRTLLPHVENDPDLMRLHFGTGAISMGTTEPDEGMISFAECIREGISQLEREMAADLKFGDALNTHNREMPLKRYAMRTVSELIKIEGKRADNQLTAQIVSVLIGAPVTANDVTQARKDLRRAYYPREK